MPQQHQNYSHITNWLFICAGLVFAMVIVGAITRLSDAGLSMVEWRPLLGVLPPLSESEWQRIFELYKNFPEYKEKHFWMALDDFKFIFFWEWFHRFLGRLIGIAYALPLLWFWIKGLIPQGYRVKLFGLLLLGGLQGLMGWYMVQSGLVDDPYVSHYRLAAHLVLALVIFALLLWFGLSLSQQKKYAQPALYIHGWLAFSVFASTIVWGAFTAGLDAGLLYNDTFPKMGGQWIPPDMWHKQPPWLNFFENHAGVQFSHRWLGIATVLSVLSLWIHAARRENTFPALHGLTVMTFIQMGLGITALITNISLPFAAAHQAGALMVLLFFVTTLRQLKN